MSGFWKQLLILSGYIGFSLSAVHSLDYFPKSGGKNKAKKANDKKKKSKKNKEDKKDRQNKEKSRYSERSKCRDAKYASLVGRQEDDMAPPVMGGKTYGSPDAVMDSKKLMSSQKVNLETKGILDLPNDILMIILTELARIDKQALLNLCCSSRAVHRLLQDDYNMTCMLLAASGQNPSTALITAAENGHDGVVNLLCANFGADVHAQEDEALSLAAACGHYRVVEILCKHEADVHACNAHALRMATVFSHYQVVDLLCAQFGANVHAKEDEALSVAAGYGHYRVVEILCKHGADVHARNDTALRWAAEFGHYQVVDILCKHGADVHAGDDTALHSAAQNGHHRVVEILCKHGADVHSIEDIEHYI